MNPWPPFVPDSPNRSQDEREFDAAVRDHDAAIAAAGLDIWAGAEPTFTDRSSQASEWLFAAAGNDKRQRAERMLPALAGLVNRPVILRTVGRQYPEEDRPRWNYGLYAHRDGRPFWSGPPDPSQGGQPSTGSALEAFWRALTHELRASGWSAIGFRSEDPLAWRVAARPTDGYLPDPETDARLQRPALGKQPIPPEGLKDELGAEGIYLFALGCDPASGAEDGFVRLELPAFADVPAFVACLVIVSAAGQAADLPGLILTGYPPPVNDTVAWTTVTPDPAVVEINMAPAAGVAQLLCWLRGIFAAAGSVGLSAYRFHYNGDFTDSGGGGQITFGGPSPGLSPFLRTPSLLPRVVAYCNRHPSLSYFFSQEAAGSSSQSPRSDERTREAFAELAVTLDLLSREPTLTPEILHTSLAPFLSDSTGNSHRTEINVEKLWNEGVPSRGCLGLVEFRALRMAPSPEMLAARACLLRAVLAMLAQGEHSLELTDWGSALHDHYALPFYLRQDLVEVLRDVEQAGFRLQPPILKALLDDDYRALAETALAGTVLRIQRAIEFWPLIGDAASQESGGSRWVDSSTTRIQVTLRTARGTPPSSLQQWRVAVDGWQPPVRFEREGGAAVLLFAFRYRSFVPWRGLHPTLGAQGPIRISLHHTHLRRTWQITLHDWRPDGGPYDGLPLDWEASAARRQERITVEIRDLDEVAAGRTPPPAAATPCCLDLRRLYGL